MKKLSLVTVIALATLSCGSPKADHEILGKVEQEEISVTGKVAGRITDIFVKEGQWVSKGDTLAILDIPELNAKRTQAQGALASADAQYQMARTGATQNQIAQLEAKKAALTEQYIFAEKSVNRLKPMVADSLVSQQTYDEAYAKLQGARAQIKAVDAEIADVKNGVRQEQQLMALGQKNRAMGAIEEVKTVENEKYILAPADMKIETVVLKPGELALPGYTLFKGALPESTYFRFTLPENDLAKVKEGQNVKVYSVYANQEIDCKVILIKKLPAYADIATAYPDYEIQQSLFEIQAEPINPAIAKDLIQRTTVKIVL